MIYDLGSITALRTLLRKIDYAFFLKQMHGAADFQDPWYDFETLNADIESSPCRCKQTIRLLHMGIPAAEKELLNEIDEKDIEALLSTGLWIRREDRICPDNYVILVYQQMYFAVEINPSFPTCTRPMTDVYIGSDSLRLAENIAYDPGCTVLDLCSGSGIQGILAARSAKRVVSVEINAKAAPIIEFNAALNGVSDVVEVRCGDLYEVLKPEERFDYIYANPPFLPVPEDTNYPICGAAGDNGLEVLKRIVDGLQEHLEPAGSAVIFCESLGDEQKVFFTDYLEKAGTAHHWSLTECRYSRIDKRTGIRNLLFLASMFDPSLDPVTFARGINEIFEQTGAKYLYSLLYRIRNGAAEPTVDLINHCMPERSPEDEIRMLENILEKMKAGSEGGCCGRG